MAGQAGMGVVIFGPMAANCLETSELSYRFSRKAIVLDKIDLRVTEGSIYGFLGQTYPGDRRGDELYKTKLTLTANAN